MAITEISERSYQRIIHPGPVSRLQAVLSGIINVLPQHYLIIPDDITRSRETYPRRNPMQIVGGVELDFYIRNKIPYVFLGGACNIINENGENTYNDGRDTLADKLQEQNIPHFDPQIWGRNYDPVSDGFAEQAAHKHSNINLFEIRPDTFGGVTAFEAIGKKYCSDVKSIVFLNSDNKKTLFRPELNKNVQTHLFEYQRAGTNLRSDCIKFLRMAGSVDSGKVIIGGNDEYSFYNIQKTNKRLGISQSKDDGYTLQNKKVFLIPKNKMCAKELLHAFDCGMRGEEIEICFQGFEKNKTAHPAFLPLGDTKGKLDEYIKEGREMKRVLFSILGFDSDNLMDGVKNESGKMVLALSEETALKAILEEW